MLIFISVFVFCAPVFILGMMERFCYVMNDSGRGQDGIDNRQWGGQKTKRGVGWKMTG